MDRKIKQKILIILKLFSCFRILLKLQNRAPPISIIFVTKIDLCWISAEI